MPPANSTPRRSYAAEVALSENGGAELDWDAFRREGDMDLSPSSFQVRPVKGIAGTAWVFDRDQSRLGELAEAGSGFLKSVTSLNTVLRVRERRPIGFRELGIQPVLRLRSASGRVIVGTPDAEVLTVEGWKCLKDLKEGEAIACPRKLGASGSRSLTKEEVDLAALLIADGGISIDRGQISYTKSDAVLQRRFRTCVEWFGARISRVSWVRGAAMAFVFDSRVSSNGKVVGVIHQFLRQLNLMGKKSREKVLPLEILELRKPLLSRFLGRLWSGDGYVLAAPNKDVQYSTASEVLARQIQHLLLRFGIWSTLRYRPKTRGWEVGIGDWENFYRFSLEIAPWLMGQTRRDFRALEARWPAPKQLGTTGDIIPNGSQLLLAAQTKAGVSAKEMKAVSIAGPTGPPVFGSCWSTLRFRFATPSDC